MTRDEIRKAINASPFEPFVIRMTSGQTYRVDHPDFVLVPPAGRTIVVYHTDDRSLAHVNLTLVEAIEYPNDKPKSRRKSG